MLLRSRAANPSVLVEMIKFKSKVVCIAASKNVVESPLFHLLDFCSVIFCFSLMRPFDTASFHHAYISLTLRRTNFLT